MPCRTIISKKEWSRRTVHLSSSSFPAKKTSRKPKRTATASATTKILLMTILLGALSSSKTVTTKLLVQSFSFGGVGGLGKQKSSHSFRSLASSLLLQQSSKCRRFQPRQYNHHQRRCLALFSATIDNTAAAKTKSKESEEINWTTDRVRSAFLDFFQQDERGNHVFAPSSSCVPLNDPTLLFANAGMNQFKPIFLGQADPNSALATLTRATNSQKCIRAGGKHNDLEDVGRDTYHHTFFEMLGSWSFGDYFKEEAITYAWELLTNVYGLDPGRLYATYFEGDAALGLEADTEARDLWLRHLPPERVIASSTKDNFWEMGDQGPCGPCSELHYDRIGNRDASSLVNCEPGDPDVIEIWNLVFIQYNRVKAAAGSSDGDTVLQPLPNKHVDTGMGLERLVSVLQDQSSNYDIDGFTAILDKIAEYVPPEVGPYTRAVADIMEQQNASPSEKKEEEKWDEATILKDVAYRAIADHARCLTFALADGAVPSNEGRGYVLRRILRRAARYGRQTLQMDLPGGAVLSPLVPTVVETYGAAYPELVENQDKIIQILQEEEKSFGSMLDRGISYFADLQEELKEAGQTTVPGQQAFYLYDTLGFPVDLTELMAEEAGMNVDVKAFNDAMQAQKDRSRQALKLAKAAAAGGSEVLELQADETAWLQDNIGTVTDDNHKYDWDEVLPAKVLAVYTQAGEFLKPGETIQPVDNSGQQQVCGLVLDRTPFYAEAGGQEADTGRMDVLDAETGQVIGTFVVTDVQVYAGFVLHTGILQASESSGEGSVSIGTGTAVNCAVDYNRRRKIVPNHSMTHILNAALREVLGDGVDQRGSLCNAEKLRFDFSHKKALKAKQLRLVEEYCQSAVENSLPVSSRVMPLEEAQKLPGVRAVFGEVYPDPVRVVSIGDETSVEFCGGTHLSNTAEAEAFVLTEETAVAKGVRRVTAVTGQAAKEAMVLGRAFEQRVGSAEGSSDGGEEAGALRKDLDAAFISATVKAELRGRIEGLQKKAADAKKKLMQQRVDQCLNTIKSQIEEVLTSSPSQKTMVLNVDIGADSKASQKVMNTVKNVAPEMAFLGLSEEEPGSGGKLLAFALVPPELVEAGMKADDWIRAALEPCGGRGGGKPGNAQGQAKECSDVAAVEEAAAAFAGQYA